MDDLAYYFVCIISIKQQTDSYNYMCVDGRLFMHNTAAGLKNESQTQFIEQTVSKLCCKQQ